MAPFVQRWLETADVWSHDPVSCTRSISGRLFRFVNLLRRLWTKTQKQMCRSIQTGGCVKAVEFNISQSRWHYFHTVNIHWNQTNWSTCGAKVYSRYTSDLALIAFPYKWTVSQNSVSQQREWIEQRQLLYMLINETHSLEKCIEWDLTVYLPPARRDEQPWLK